ncbi:acetate--CoA ligase family protein [Ferrovibrio sp.]|uniref:acetate--CoA ligase family protein n=1 Tax=Ferrovibrio sp. TaxID=1917215 RepID=UPI0035B4EA52
MELGAGLDALLQPRSIAVIGASQDVTKIGGRPIQLLAGHGYAGKVFPVNPKGGEIQGLKAYASVTDIPETPDLAVIAVGAEHVLAAARDCAAKGVRAAVVLSSGFAELGAAGEAIQHDLTALARQSGLRILGPNCLGAVSIPERSIATFSIVLEEMLPRQGGIGIVSQSGNLGSYTMRMAAERGAGISRFIATGNECDIGVADGIAWMARDPATNVILCCMETCRDAPALIAAMAAARRAGKPVIVLKIGTSDAGQAAAASHTGALAGSDAVFDAVLRRAGAIRVRSIEQFLNVGHAASLLLPDRLPKGSNVALVTASGGFGVMLADAASAAGLKLPALTEPSQKMILDAVPYASPRNPVDATAQMSSRPEILEQVLSAVMADENCDAVVQMMALSLYLPRLRKVYLEAFRRVREKHPDRLLMLCIHGPADGVAEVNALGFPTVDGIDACCETLAALAQLGRQRNEVVQVAPAATIPANAIPASVFGDEYASKRLLADHGIPVLQERLAADEDGVLAAARELGLPVVLKIVSPDIAHKTEVGGVLVGLRSDEEVRAGYRTILENVRRKAPQARIAGVIVAPMAAAGTELILGTSRDPIFGPVVMVGLGGIFAEVLRDTAVMPVPVRHDEALAMLRSLKAFPVLDGARGGPKADIQAAAKAIVALSEFAARHAGQIAEIDINPLRLLPEGQGAVALDALLIPQQDGKAVASS